MVVGGVPTFRCSCSLLQLILIICLFTFEYNTDCDSGKGGIMFFGEYYITGIVKQEIIITCANIFCHCSSEHVTYKLGDTVKRVCDVQILGGL